MQNHKKGFLANAVWRLKCLVSNEDYGSHLTTIQMCRKREREGGGGELHFFWLFLPPSFLHLLCICAERTSKKQHVLNNL